MEIAFPIHDFHGSRGPHPRLSKNNTTMVPCGLENKGKLYISKSSPKCVLDAYLMQFQNDFSHFLESRSHEMVNGGKMVLSLLGRESMDPTVPHSCYHWELLAHALMAMVSEEENVDCFDAPYYAPCIEEMKLEIEKEGSFMLDSHNVYEIDGMLERNHQLAHWGCYQVVSVLLGP
ncbi:unnamed protein product [Lupinus luteus]|uniref:Uncharacterized protein n=1 Tax=Lupinus luteus TaxID=3873 RepID=A0AAV1XL52_LUPLU